MIFHDNRNYKMIALAALMLFVLWGFISYKISCALIEMIRLEIHKKTAISILTFVAFFVPIIDEVIGGFQFRCLCEAEALLVFDEIPGKGKKVVYQPVRDVKINKYYVPILERNWSYADFDTGRLIISWKSFEAQGGWLSRKLNLLGASQPLIFNGKCAPKGAFGIDFRGLNISVVN